MNKMKAVAVTSASLGVLGLVSDSKHLEAQDVQPMILNFSEGRLPALEKNPKPFPGQFKNPPAKNPPSKNPPSKNPFPTDPPVKNPQLNVRVAVQTNVRPAVESQYAIKCLQLLAGKVTARGIEKASAQEIRSAEWCLKAFAKGLL